MCTLPGEVAAAPRCPPTESERIMLSEDGSLSPKSAASNTLLRQLLAGADLASVRNYSELVNSKYSLRRTSSLSVASRNRFHRANIEAGLTVDEMRPRRATMFSQLSLSRRICPEQSNEASDAKRSKGSDESISICSDTTPLSVKIESGDAVDSISKVLSSDTIASTNKSRRIPIIEKESIESDTSSLPPPPVASTGASISRNLPSFASMRMRPRAYTASELENVLKVNPPEISRFLEYYLNGPLANGTIPRACRSLDPISSVPNFVSHNDLSGKTDKSDITSPLSQLLESTPPYHHVPRKPGNPASAWQRGLSLNSSLSSNALNAVRAFPTTLRMFSSKSDSLQNHHQILDLSTNTSPTEMRAADLFVAKSTTDQVLDYSRKDLSIIADDLSEWPSTQQAAMLQDLFRHTCLAAETVPPITLTPQSPSIGSLSPSWPVRLAAKSSHLLCRRVGEWLLAADAYTTRCCVNVPTSALLATAAFYRYCRCSEKEPSPLGKIASTHVMPELSRTLKAALQRIWPLLLLTSMIRENFSFAVTPFTELELEAAANSDTNGALKAPGEVRDLLIARMSTAQALLGLIQSGNQLLLDTQVLEHVRKCIFAQYAYPSYFPTSYFSSMEELRKCCHKCSGDPSLFTRVLLLMNEMQSISPEDVHCLFSIDKLSALFS